MCELCLFLLIILGGAAPVYNTIFWLKRKDNGWYGKTGTILSHRLANLKGWARKAGGGSPLQ